MNDAKQKCADCDGSGGLHGMSMFEACPTCKGSGKVSMADEKCRCGHRRQRHDFH